jgi:hypothetical protein
VTIDGSDTAAGSLLSSVLALSTLVTSLDGVDVTLVGPPRRLVLYLYKTMYNVRIEVFSEWF